MAIVKSITSPNGVSVTIHKILKIELIGDMTSVNVQVGSWPDQLAYLANDKAPIWNWYLTVPVAFLVGEPVECIEAALVMDGAFIGGVRVLVPSSDSLDGVKARKRAEINSCRLLANRGTFPYDGEDISCDELGRAELVAVSTTVALTGALPVGFMGSWKTANNTYISIPDVATWKAVFQSMVDQGSINFFHSEALKTLLNDATTPVEVGKISWGMALPPQR